MFRPTCSPLGARNPIFLANLKILARFCQILSYGLKVTSPPILMRSFDAHTYTLTILLIFLFSYIYIYIYVGDCNSENNIYVGLISTTLSRWLTMHICNTSFIWQHLKKHSYTTTDLRKILTESTTILEQQNNKQKLQILEALRIRNIQPKLNRINFETSANVFKCL